MSNENFCSAWIWRFCLLCFVVLVNTLALWNAVVGFNASSIGSRLFRFARLQQNISERFFSTWTDSAKSGLKANCGLITVSHNLDSLGYGNLMFLYASLIGIARTNGKVPFFTQDQKFPLPDIFEMKRLVKIHTSTVKFSRMYEYGCCKYNAELANLNCHDNVTLGGYLQSWKYFKDSFHVVRSEFTFKSRILQESTGDLEKILRLHNKSRTACNIVGVHARRGDFTGSAEREVGHVPATADYLQHAVDYFRKKYRNHCLLFILAGNDYGWNLKNAPKGSDVHVVEPKTPAIDLCILTHCNHTIMSTGTFGWWASFLAQGHTVYQKSYTTVGSKLDMQFRKEDHFLPDWVGL